MMAVVVGAALMMACDSSDDSSSVPTDDAIGSNQQTAGDLPEIFSGSSEAIVLRKLNFTTALVDGNTIQCRSFPDYDNTAVIGVEFFEASVNNTFTERRYSFDAQSMMLTETDPFGGTAIDYTWSISDGNLNSDAWRWWFLIPELSSEPLPQFAESLGAGIWAYYKTTFTDFPARVVTNLNACRFLP